MTAFPDPRQVPVDGLELEVFEAGVGRPLVLCHGWPEHAYSWRHQLPALVEAGYHVIAPNQRGYGRSSRPDAVEDYDALALAGDLAGLLDHYGYDDALFIGHDWGAIVLWHMAVLRPERMAGLINLSVPFMPRGSSEWVGFWEKMLGPDFYIVHFNRQPGVAERVFEADIERFLRSMYRTGQWLEPGAGDRQGTSFLEAARDNDPPGELIMSDEELAVFVDAFRVSGFTAPLNWYRNFTRNWHTLADYEERVRCPTLMIYGSHDLVPPRDDLADYVDELETATLDCGHWIMQEQPMQTTALMLDWLARHYPAG